jgi:lipoprotein-anchoring transpeptidase ErfK/SrfK
MRHRTICAAAAAFLLACSTASDAAKIHLFDARMSKHHAGSVARSRPQPQPVPYRWTQGAAPQAHRDMVATFHKIGLAPGQYLVADKIPAEGETRVVIDLQTQMAYVYRADQLVGASTISTARRGMVTPLGFWSVLEKRRFYRSKKYQNAAMPWMQRIDSYGIAIHGGGTPGFPESHGCIHLPTKFAEKLYGLTKVGSKVVIEG